VLAIVEGRYDSVRQPPPRRSPDELRYIARVALATAGRPPLSDPRHVALAGGARLLPRAPSGLCGEGTQGGTIAYDWGAEPKLRGLLVAHGDAHRILSARPENTNEADAWWLTVWMLMPRPIVRELTVAQALDRVWAPAWFVTAVMAEVHGWIPEENNQSSGL